MEFREKVGSAAENSAYEEMKEEYARKTEPTAAGYN